MPHPSTLPLALVLALASTAACSERQPSSEAASANEQSAPAPRIDAQRAQALLAAGGILVDVREPAELAETGKLRSALHLPLPSIRAQASKQRIPPELDAYRARPVILYCRTGRRSGQAAEILRRLGVTDVYNLGGFEEAARAGFPVEPGAAAD
ncbi:MAG TPA: rhodanese-like domain-containing protein [Sphingomicrobium sp.]|nr:rhodanese-like domain-containing protein [Sphingomicrobium sp.]